MRNNHSPRHYASYTPARALRGFALGAALAALSTTSLSVAQVAPSPAPTSEGEPAPATAEAAPTQVERRAEPVTPFPMNLPDDVTSREIEGEYGIGIAGLALLIVAGAVLVGGSLFGASLLSWQKSRRASD